MRVFFTLLVISALAVASYAERPAYCGIIPNQNNVPSKALTTPPAGYNLTLLQVLIRHGDRLPIDSCWANDNVWDCNLNIEERSTSQDVSSGYVSRLHRKHYINGENVFPGKCMAGQLTQFGYRQHMENGNNLRTKYMTSQNSFLGHTFDASKMTVRSTDIPRTLQSAQALLRGLYPWTANTSTEFVDVYTVDAANEWMFPNPSFCPLLAHYENSAKYSPAYKQWIQQTMVPLLNDLAVAYGVPVEKLPKPIAIFDCLSAHKCHNFPFPGGLNDDLFNRIFAAMEWEYAYTYNFPSAAEYGRLAMGRLYNEIYNNFVEALQGNNKAKLHLFSGHDTTVMPFLNAIKAWNGKWAPYAAEVIMELWRNPQTGAGSVRFIYNGEELTIPGCEGVFCSFNDFTNIVAPILLKNPTQACSMSVQVEHNPLVGVYSIDGSL